MKTIPFNLADIGEGIAEVELLQWFINAGDPIRQFDRVCEVQSDKATVEITSRYDGKVLSLSGKVGDMMKVGKPLLLLDVAGKAGDEDKPQSAVAASVDDKADRLTVPHVVAAAASSASSSSSNASSSSSQSSYNQQHHSPSSDIDHDEQFGRVKTTPAVRKMAKENGIDLTRVIATGPQGRVLKEDVLAYLSSGAVARRPSPTPQTHASAKAGGGVVSAGAAASPAASSSSSSPSSSSSSSSPALARPLLAAAPGGTSVHPIRGYSRMMVKSMQASLSVPHFGYADEVSLTSLALLRTALKPSAEKVGVKLSYLPFMLKAASVAMLEYPTLNASLSDDQASLILHHDHNIGVAMDTPKGLVVPNIKRVQDLSVFEIASELNRLMKDAAAGSIKDADLKGTTFSLSNIGAVGGTYMSPVIVPPMVAIGAVGKIQRLPRFKGQSMEVVEELVMNISWAGDHRVVDGATMARFSNVFKECLEVPGVLIAKLR